MKYSWHFNYINIVLLQITTITLKTFRTLLLLKIKTKRQNQKNSSLVKQSGTDEISRGTEISPVLNNYLNTRLHRP